MKKILETRVFQSEASSVWEIISDISRSDWVPRVESIYLDG